MATTIYAYQVIFLAGCDLTSGAQGIMDVGPNPVTQVRWRIPPGPQGLLSWWLYQSGAAVYPVAASDGVIGDNEWDTWVLDNPPTNPIWEAWGVNGGADDHVVEYQFFTDTLASSGSGTVDLTAIFPQTDDQWATMYLA